VHPTQIYEVLGSLVILVLLLWVLEPRLRNAGSLFWSYLGLAGVERFLVEFVRTNTPVALGLTQAQWMSLGLMVAGGIGVWWIESHGTPAEAPRVSTAPGSKNKKAHGGVAESGRGGRGPAGGKGSGAQRRRHSG
jgi:prolipoprotein diacylglyceryltransferase